MLCEQISTIPSPHTSSVSPPPAVLPQICLARRPQHTEPHAGAHRVFLPTVKVGNARMHRPRRHAQQHGARTDLANNPTAQRSDVIPFDKSVL